MYMKKTNKRRTALITGATSGIGAAYAYALAEKGHDLIITGRRREIIEDVAKQIREKFPVNVFVSIVELSETIEVDQLIKTIEKIGPIDILVNNAGFTTKGLFYQQDIIEQKKMVLVHNIAMMRLVHAVLPYMIERGCGAIINVSSIQAVTPMSLSVTYSSAKAFIKNFSISLHCEVGKHGVRVLCVLPGFTRTDLGRYIGVDMTMADNMPFTHWMPPEEVVKISLRELRRKNNVICVPGYGNKVLYIMAKMIPEHLWYRLVPKIVGRMP
jgi:short-subunit dehydrogenase